MAAATANYANTPHDMKHTPTMKELIDAYLQSAEAERIKRDRPCRRTTANVIIGVSVVCRTLQGESGGGDWREWPAAAVTRKALDRYLMTARSRGVSPITAWSYLQSFRSLTAKWTLRYYEDRGWKIRPFEIPSCARRPPRYVRPDRAVLEKVKEWYGSLEMLKDRRLWLAATLMLEFAMRNGDVAKLKWSAFRVQEPADSGAYLSYMPNKTALSSGRTVNWPVHPCIWERLAAIRADSPLQSRVLPNAAAVFAELNRDLRKRRIFTGHKAMYELRKICIDHVYQKFGAEMASSISGDDIRTVTRYYADPSAVNMGAVRIIDLL